MDFNSLPLISTIVPYYNSRFDLFKEAIESVLSQSYAHWEIIIVNDGSETKNKTALDNYIKDLNENRISVVHLKENRGVSIAKNTGVDVSRGEIVTFLDADDLHLPWYYDEIINCFYKSPEALALYTGYTMYLKIGDFIKFIYYHDSPSFSKEKENYHVYLYFPRPVFKKECFEKIKFSSDFSCSEDTDLYFQALNDSELLAKSIIMAGPGYVYRLHRSNSRLTHKLDSILNCRQLLIDKYGNDDSVASKVIKRWQGIYHYWKFNKELSEYLRDKSIVNYLKKIFFTPRSFKDKIRGIKSLFYITTFYRLLLPFFAVNLLYIESLKRLRSNKHKEFKTFFQDYLNNLSNFCESKYYVKRMYERIF